MIKLLCRDTCRYANIPHEDIVEMVEDSVEDSVRVYPYTRLHIVNEKQKHDYYIEVTESKKYIESLIAKAEEESRNAKPTTEKT